MWYFAWVLGVGFAVLLVDAQGLAVMGHSVGAGAALLTATRRTDVRAVISLSAFAHLRV